MLDRVSQQAVLASLRASLSTRRPALLGELRALAAEGVIGPGSGLADWLEALAMEPADFYGVRGAGFTSLRRELGWLPVPPIPRRSRSAAPSAPACSTSTIPIACAPPPSPPLHPPSPSSWASAIGASG